MFWNIVFLIAFSIGAIGWAISAAKNTKIWGKIFEIFLASTHLILANCYVFMIMTEALGL